MAEELEETAFEVVRQSPDERRGSITFTPAKRPKKNLSAKSLANLVGIDFQLDGDNVQHLITIQSFLRYKRDKKKFKIKSTFCALF